MKESYVISVEGLTKRYKKQCVVNNVSFNIRKGSICGLVGPNGAGKTTIMKMLGGLVIPSEGKLAIFGQSDDKGLAKSRERMSFMIETPYVKSELSAVKNLEKQRLQKGIANKDRIGQVLELVGLGDVDNKAAKKFSLGMRQRLGIANAMLTMPEIMVLDEPVNGLDPEGIVEIRQLLKKLNEEENMTIIISSHILSELSLLCDEYLFINGGNIVKHITKEQLARECRNYLYIHTDNDEKALALLQEHLKVEDYTVDEKGGIILFEYVDNVGAVSRVLCDNKILPLELYVGGETLEEYYMSITGGRYVEHN